jgi:hypothetical protein
MRISRLCVAAAASMRCLAAIASGELETHEAHEHGVAALNIAIEGSRVELALDSPSINVLGFEHAPRSDSERAAVARAQRTLEGAERLFALTHAAECRLTSSDVVAPTWSEDDTHADYEAHYAFLCAKPELLRTIDVQLVEHLQDGTKLRVQIVARGRQTGAELTRGRSLIAIR